MSSKAYDAAEFRDIIFDSAAVAAGAPVNALDSQREDCCHQKFPNHINFLMRNCNQEKSTLTL